MSIAEFYIENGIDPTDPDSYDNWVTHVRSGRSADTFVASSAYGIAHQRDASSRGEASNWPLNESELDYMGETRGWEKIDGASSQAPMASYWRDDMRLNFWLSTGTVGSYLDHPQQGKTQLFRREVDMSEAAEIFQNPRVHTDKGYQRKENQQKGAAKPAAGSKIKPCRYGSTCKRQDCWFDHSGSPPTEGMGLGPCRFGEKCTRAGCWYEHP